uniref:Polyubiquitin-B n=1 Tax=Lygus hesperus TaxID=30085 RepID=A0A0A9XGW7_LYGHE
MEIFERNGTELYDVAPQCVLPGNLSPNRKDELTEFFVKTTSGKTVALHLNLLTYNVAQLKEIICDKEQLPDLRYNIVYRGSILSDNSTLSECGLEQFSTLHLNPVVCGGYQIYKLRVVNHLNMIFEVEVAPHDLVLQVKKEIFNESHIPPENQKLLYNGMELDNNKTVSDYGITGDSTLNMTLCNHIALQVVVYNSRRSYTTIDIDPEDSVETLRAKIIEKIGIAPEPNSWVVRGKRVVFRIRILC